MTDLATLTSAAMASGSASGEPAVPVPGENLAPAETVVPGAPSAAPEPGVDPGTVAPETPRRIIPSEQVVPQSQADAVLDSVPGQPAAYDLGPPPTVEQGGVDLTPDFRIWAHEVGLTQRQASTLVAKYNERAEQFVENLNVRMTTDGDADVAAMMQEMGETAFNTDIVEAGNRAVAHLGLDIDTVNAIEDVLGTRGVLELAAKVGALLQGQGNAPAPVPSTDSGLSPPMEALEQLKSDKSFMTEYLSGSKPALRRMTRATQAAFGGQRR